MKISAIARILIFTYIITLLVGCGNTTPTPVNPSSDASIQRFRLQDPQGSSALLNTTVFTINEVNDSIYNLDSLPYGTKVDSIQPSITFASSGGFIINDTLTYGMYETPYLNFSKKIKITNVASDGKTKQDYIIDVRVHKVETYKHNWVNLTSNISNNLYENQKALFFKDNFYFFSGNNLYHSTDAVSWHENTIFNGLPANPDLRNIVEFQKDQKLYLFQNGVLYSTSDAQNWSVSPTTGDFNFKTLLFSFQNKLWAIGQEKTSGEYIILNSEDAVNFISVSAMPADFPVSNFTATNFTPSYGLEKVIIIGGKDKNKKVLNTRWVSETGKKWFKLEKQGDTFTPIYDAAIIWYGNKLLLIGGSNESGNIIDKDLKTKKSLQLRTSPDEGLTWITPDSTKNELPSDFKSRTNASVFKNNKTNFMYIIGGTTLDSQANDVWRVKVNFYDFKDFNPKKY